MGIDASANTKKISAFLAQATSKDIEDLKFIARTGTLPDEGDSKTGQSTAAEGVVEAAS